MLPEIILNVLLHPTEMHIQLVEMLQKSSQRCSFGHLSKGVDILWEAFAAISELSVRTWDIGVHIIDIAR